MNRKFFLRPFFAQSPVTKEIPRCRIVIGQHVKESEMRKLFEKFFDFSKKVFLREFTGAESKLHIYELIRKNEQTLGMYLLLENEITCLHGLLHLFLEMDRGTIFYFIMRLQVSIVILAQYEI